MRKLLLLFAVLLSARPSTNAQRLVCERAHRRNPDSLCQWVDNRLVLEDFRGDRSRVTAKAARGNIRRDISAQGACRFIYTCPASVAGFDTIVIETHQNRLARETTTDIFPVKPFPTPMVELAGKLGGPLNQVVLRAHFGISVPISLPIDCKAVPHPGIARMMEYRMEVWRGQDVIFEEHVANTNGLFTDRMKAFFQNSLRAGDRLRFFSIRLLLYQQERRKTTQELWFDLQ